MNAEWLIIRGSGIVAYGLLSASTIWGLMVSTKVLGRAVKAKGVTWFHESLGIASVLATIVHIVVLSTHDFLEFTWAELLVPGRSDWEPTAIAFGIVAFYGAVLISSSFYVKRWIGQRAWRAIHFGSLGVFVAALLHGITSGTDTQAPWVSALYGATGALFVLLVAVRVSQEMATASAGAASGRASRDGAAKERRPPSRPAGAPAGSADVASRVRALASEDQHTG